MVVQNGQLVQQIKGSHFLSLSVTKAIRYHSRISANPTQSFPRASGIPASFHGSPNPEMFIGDYKQNSARILRKSSWPFRKPVDHLDCYYLWL
ncbi:hypothetical protein L596_028873 [Steinernema carpocapsae]|nr:hypothetical protein L596_028873 [Steinernema carpocapsae]